MSIYKEWFIQVLVVVDWITVFVGVVGNVLTLIALLNYEAIRNPIMKALFVSLTISDLGVLLMRHTFHSIQLYNEGRWIFGELACKIIPPVSRTFLTVAVLTLVVISYRRYKCVISVFDSEPSTRKTLVTISLIWCTVFTLYFFLDFPLRKLDETTGRCTYRDSGINYSVFAIVEKALYALSIACIVWMCQKMRRALKGSLRVQERSSVGRKLSLSAQMLKILRPTVVVLLITLPPAWILHTFAILGGKRWNLGHIERYTIYHFVGILMVFNSASNPFIYVIMSRGFAISFKKIVRSFCLTLKFWTANSAF
ncbi:neuromedin-U receptor 2-like [Dendronephthya gigantea]|uniref:neuromedin-U receptor 2-like n=1 Tax=Dendronephthya gigantea TaxID=151771 RepID=UPI00106AB423|nr:neuromedin-U receptor 2-like [Dendronephthya gigantea]